MNIECRSQSPAQTEQIGEVIGQHLEAGDCLCLSGALGAGKTQLTRGIARGWGSENRVTSPTFMLIQQYAGPPGKGDLYHVDAYRLRDSNDALTTGLGELLDTGQTLVIEWPERLADLLPADRIEIRLTVVDDDQRILSFTATEPDTAARLTPIKRALSPFR